jgi:hypothetical protein
MIRLKVNLLCRGGVLVFEICHPSDKFVNSIEWPAEAVQRVVFQAGRRQVSLMAELG